MKAFITLLTVCLLAMAPAHALQITDDRGVSVTLAHSPQRIVSLLPSLTESVCTLDPNIEAIVAFKPDVMVSRI